LILVKSLKQRAATDPQQLRSPRLVPSASFECLKDAATLDRFDLTSQHRR